MSINFDELKSKIQHFIHINDSGSEDKSYSTTHTMFGGIMNELLDYLSDEYEMGSVSNKPTMGIITPKELKNNQRQHQIQHLQPILHAIEQNIIHANKTGKHHAKYACYEPAYVVNEVIIALRASGYSADIAPRGYCQIGTHLNISWE